jgi:hypothetical protein
MIGNIYSVHGEGGGGDGDVVVLVVLVLLHVPLHVGCPQLQLFFEQLNPVAHSHINSAIKSSSTIQNRALHIMCAEYVMALSIAGRPIVIPVIPYLRVI